MALDLDQVAEETLRFLEGEGEMPADFLLYRACTSWQKLPHEGGMLDQEFELMMRFEGFKRGEERRKRKESFYNRPLGNQPTQAGPVPDWAQRFT